MKLSEYPPIENVIDGIPFPLAKIKRLKALFPKESRLELQYDPDVEEVCDLWIRYQAKPRGHWKYLGTVAELDLRPLPGDGRIEFIGWLNDYYNDVVDIEDSEIDKAYAECNT